jgi:hypothetical protein
MMQAGVIRTAYSTSATCRCHAPSQHALFRFLFYNPGVSLKLAAREVHLSYPNVRLIKSRLNRRTDLHLRCPECFQPKLAGLTCTACGVELDAPLLPEGVRFELTSPVYSLQPLNGLGSSTPYSQLHFQYGAKNVQHLAERFSDPFVESAKSKLWEELKTIMPPDEVTEEATRLLLKEIVEFRGRYPGLVRAKGVSTQLVSNVVSRLALRYPALRERNSATGRKPVLESEANTE